jgi:cbb3-type cytochrome oxidase cytochrome c subunit
MPTHILDAASISPGTRYVYEKQLDLLEASIEELANLRFSIVLTARWEVSAAEDLERRAELRDELEDLRRQYSQKIDDIAMSFGIQIAMNVKEDVERTVAIPTDMDRSLAPSEDGEFDL